ncbi:MAG: leucyl aminopeptidase [bacterium]|nr:leucyl aminopeptidase [bacterium]
MNNELLSAGGQKIVKVNGRVKPSEKVLIITDHTMQNIADSVIKAAQGIGAEVVTCIMSPRDKDGQEPPDSVAAAMKAADVFFAPVSYSITHTKATRAALENGARGIMMTQYNEDILSSPSLIKTDFEAQAEVCHRYGRVFTGGEKVTVTSSKGTDLSFSIKGRTANILTGIPEPGNLAPVPTIEVNVVPVHGTTQGVAIVDASVPYIGIGVLKEPIICTIEDGYITKIEGGEQARMLEDNLNSHGDRNCFNHAELGVGLNPNARLNGVMLEDEGVIGTIHLGIGTSFTLGGEIVAPTHYDLLIWDTTVKVDDKITQKERTILV